MLTTARIRAVAALATTLTATVCGLALAAPVGTAPPATGPPPALFDLASVADPQRIPAARAVFPVKGRVGYGETGAKFGASRGGRRHEGQDVFAPAGTPLLAISDGVVLETGNDGGRGNYVALFSPAARRTYVYLHLQRPPRVRAGERVRAGQRLGAVGCTGSCFGDHLHLEVRRGRSPQGEPLDPLPLLRRLRRRG